MVENYWEKNIYEDIYEYMSGYFEIPSSQNESAK